MRDPVSDWELFGRVDPYYGVITCDEFHSKDLSADSMDRFFESGKTHVASLIRVIRRHIDPDFCPRKTLEFGCGVGRLLIPLAGECEAAVGMDVSAAMLRQAKRHLEARGISNAELIHTDGDGGFQGLSERFDFVHSYIVLQHVPRRRGVKLFRELLGLLSEGGVGAIHVAFYGDLPRWRLLINWMQKSVPFVQQLVNLAKGRSLGYPHMQMNHYDLNKLFVVLFKASARKLHVEFTDHGGHLGAYFLFQKGRAADEDAPHLSFGHLKSTDVAPAVTA